MAHLLLTNLARRHPTLDLKERRLVHYKDKRTYARFRGTHLLSRSLARVCDPFVSTVMSDDKDLSTLGSADIRLTDCSISFGYAFNPVVSA